MADTLDDTGFEGLIFTGAQLVDRIAQTSGPIRVLVGAETLRLTNVVMAETTGGRQSAVCDIHVGEPGDATVQMQVSFPTEHVFFTDETFVIGPVQDDCE